MEVQEILKPMLLNRTLENIEEMFPWYSMYNDIFSSSNCFLLHSKGLTVDISLILYFAIFQQTKNTIRSLYMVFSKTRYLLFKSEVNIHPR